MMKVFSAFLLFLGISSYEVVAEQAIACENCSQAQAEVLVRERASKAIWCETPRDEYYERGNRSCYSNAADVYVVNLATGQSYGFHHYHTNQGLEPGYLQLHMQSIAVTNAYRQMLLEFSQSVKSYRSFLQTLADQAVLPSEFAASSQASVTMASGGTGGGTCPANSPVRKAIEAALSEHTRASLQFNIQRQFNSAVATGRFKSVQGAFESLRITALGAEFGKNNSGFNVQWDRSVGGATKRVNFHPDWLPPEQGPGNEVAWSVTPDNQGNISVTLNPKQTYIEGLLLDSLMVGGSDGFGSSTPLLSACAVEAFIAALAKRTGSFRNSGGKTLTPSQIISVHPGQGGGIGGCDVLFYDSRGELQFVFTNMKCSNN